MHAYAVEPLRVRQGSSKFSSREGCREVFTCTGKQRPTWRKVPVGELVAVSLLWLIVLAGCLYSAAVFSERD